MAFNVSEEQLNALLEDEMSRNKNYVVIGLYIPVFLLALFANTLVIIVVIKYHYMRRTRLMVYPRYHLPDMMVTEAPRVTNYFLVNLSAADLLVTIVCMPYAIWNASQNFWYLGNISCMLIGYLQCVAVGASVFTITAMAIDRYLAITQPIGFPRWFNKTSTTIVILTLWLVSLFIFSPMLWISQTKNITVMNHTEPPLEWTVCQEDWTTFMEYKTYIGVFWFAITYVVPGVLMVVAYSLMGRRLCSVRPPFDTHEGSASTQQGFRLVRERKRVAWILLLLALLFAACWLPHSILNLLLDTGDFTETKWLMPYCILLGHANSAINPIIYCFMTRNFRRSVKELVFRTRNNFTTRRTNRGQYVDSGSASSQRWQQKVQLEPVLKMRSMRNQSSTRTTKTCAV